MKLSTKARYGLRLMIELARQYGKDPILIEEIATRQEISFKYLYTLVGGLKKAGLVTGHRGPKGGYSLAKDPYTVSALDIIQILEGENLYIRCIQHKEECARSNSCVARNLWSRVQTSAYEILQQTTLAELTKEQATIDKQNNREAI